MSERLSKAAPAEAPSYTHDEPVIPIRSRVGSTFIEMEAILQYIKREQSEKDKSGAETGTVETVIETDEVLIFWKHHTTRMRPVHANSHRTTF